MFSAFQTFGRLGLSGGGRSGATPAMPAGAIGIWYADEYTASPKRMIPNSAMPAAGNANLLNGSRRVFGNELWQKIGCAATDETTTGPDGTNSASTLTGAGNFTLGSKSTATPPAGTYTVGCNVKSASGSDEVFAFTMDNTATRSAVKTANTSWQRFSYTSTLNGSQSLLIVSLCSSDGSTGASLYICDLELYAGAVDLGPTAPDGNLYLGRSSIDAVPACSGGELDLTGSAGIVQFASDTTYTDGMTAMALVKQLSSSLYSAFLSKIQSYGNFTAYVGQSNKPAINFGGAGHLSQDSGLWNLTDLGYHVITHRRTATHIELWVDDCCIRKTAVSPSAVTARDFWVGAVNNLELLGTFKANSVALWGRSLTDDEIRSSVSMLQARAALSSLTATSVSRVYCAEGDSITEASGCYAYLAGPNLTPQTIGANYAISGSSISNAVTRAPLVDAMLPVDRTGRTFILSLLLGANDLGSAMTNPQRDSWLASMAAYCDARRSAGWKVVICTVLPSSSADRNSNRNYVNPILRTWVGTHADAVADFGGDATVGTDASGSNVTYYPDGLHPSAATHAILEPILRTAVNSL